MMQYSLFEIKTIYTDTFDFSKNYPLYMTYNKFDTQKERGQMLAKLKVLYEMFGLKMVDNELSDYLPLMLQFLQIADWENDDRAQENLQLIIMIIEDGTYEMANELAKNNNPYAYVIKALRKTLKACIESPRGWKAMLNQFIWIIYPYLCLTIFIIGHLARYKYDQFSWTAKSSELIEKKQLKWGSLLFHLGVIPVFLGMW